MPGLVLDFCVNWILGMHLQVMLHPWLLPRWIYLKKICIQLTLWIQISTWMETSNPDSFCTPLIHLLRSTVSIPAREKTCVCVSVCSFFNFLAGAGGWDSYTVICHTYYTLALPAQCLLPQNWLLALDHGGWTYHWMTPSTSGGQPARSNLLTYFVSWLAGTGTSSNIDNVKESIYR